MQKLKSLNLRPKMPYSQIFWKNEIPKFGIKNIFLGYFWARILKSCFILESVPSNLSKKSFQYTLLYIYITKGSMSAFSEGLGHRPSLLYKVCRVSPCLFNRLPHRRLYVISWFSKKLHIKCEFSLYVYLKSFSR